MKKVKGRDVRCVGDPLTPKQIDFYKWIYEKTKENGYQPSRKEIAERMGCKHPSGTDWLIRLLSKLGYTTPNPGKQRVIRFLRKPDGSPFVGFKDADE